MGILSGVSLVAPGGILNALMGEKVEAGSVRDALWAHGAILIVAGSVLAVLGALFFYRQRSLLAWYYGQMSLIDSRDPESPSKRRTLATWLRDADSWETWKPYHWGFTFLIASFLAFLGSFVVLFLTQHLKLSDSCVSKMNLFGSSGLVLLALLRGSVCAHVLDRYSYDDEPWVLFCQSLRNIFKKTHPHDGVYTRLRRSPISGIGVFAIRDIPEGTYIFEPDNGKLMYVPESTVENLWVTSQLAGNDIQRAEAETQAVKQLYKDFCVLKNGKYACPDSLNNLAPSWFLNHSELPNVAADLSLRFYATRDIKSGEELTTDYGTYSEGKAVFLESNRTAP
jgi:hypothetical protein